MLTKGFTGTVWFLVLCLCATGIASEQATEQALYQLLSPIKGLSAQFSQHTMDTEGNIFQTSSGQLTATEANKIRWIVKQPLAQQIISDGSKVWIYDPDLQQVIIQPFTNNPQTNPINLLLGENRALSETFNMVYRRTEKPRVDSYILTPKISGVLYQSLQLDFVADTPKSIKYVDSLSQTTYIDLEKVILNPQLPDNFFIFEIPQAVDIVDHVN